MLTKLLAKKQNNNLLIRFGVLGLMMVMALIIAACQPAAQATTQTADQSTQPQGFGGGNGQRPNFQMTPAPELPAATPVARGVVTKIDGNTLTVQEGGFDFGQSNGGNGGTPRPRPTSDGTPRPRPTQAAARTVQVVVNGDTQYYQDVTFANLNGQPPSGAIQQKVEKGSLSALTDNERITVWGDQNGDQITAKVIVYSQFRGGGQPQQPPQG
jgi:hypothetical protein